MDLRAAAVENELLEFKMNAWRERRAVDVEGGRQWRPFRQTRIGSAREAQPQTTT